MTDTTFDPKLWTARSPEETQALYKDWAGTYDADVTEAGYATPARLAKALAGLAPDKTAPLLDFGCGTGLSGAALTTEGFSTIDGTDITPAMLDQAETRGVYRKLWLSRPGAAPPKGYAMITATGVISLGAAPPDTLASLLDTLSTGGLLALSYNDATLADKSFMDAMEAAKTRAMLLFEEHGPHLPAKSMGSTIYVLRKP